MQRRALLKVGAVTAAALGLLGGGAALLYKPAWEGGRLTEQGRSVLVAVAKAVLDGSLPGDAGLQQAALSAHLARLAVMLNALPAATQREVNQLLALLATSPGRLALAGLTTDWLQAGVEQLQAAMQGMRESRISVRRQVYHALRDLTHAAYFADRGTWSQLGYPGPTAIA